MEIVQDQKHECKVCKKRFFSGRSLGGHMRCHMAMNPAPTPRDENENPIEDEIGSEDDGGQTGYGLRENPKKSWRLSGTKQDDEGEEHVCKVCGKGFNSSRALFGHMRHHSRQENLCCRECGKGFCTLRALSGHMRCHSKSKRFLPELKGSDSSCQSQDETSCPTRRKRSRRYKISSSVTLSEPDDLEEGALCLMLLSRAVRSWEELNNSAMMIAASHQNYVRNGGETSKTLKGSQCGGNVLSEMKTTGIGYCDSGVVELEVYDDECLRNDGSLKKKKVDFVSERGEGEMNNSEIGGHTVDVHGCSTGEMKGGSCSECVKGDLEGKKKRSCGVGNKRNYKYCSKLMLKCSGAAGRVVPRELKKDYECEICLKVFASGQALGGHKRAHFAAGSSETTPLVVLLVQVQGEGVGEGEGEQLSSEPLLHHLSSHSNIGPPEPEQGAGIKSGGGGHHDPLVAVISNRSEESSVSTPLTLPPFGDQIYS